MNEPQIKVSHLRVCDKDGEEVYMTSHAAREAGLTVRAKGGLTSVTFLDPEGEALAEGIALCSRLDNFCKWKGRAIATGRARKKLAELNVSAVH